MNQNEFNEFLRAPEASAPLLSNIDLCAALDMCEREMRSGEAYRPDNPGICGRCVFAKAEIRSQIAIRFKASALANAKHEESMRIVEEAASSALAEFQSLSIEERGAFINKILTRRGFLALEI